MEPDLGETDTARVRIVGLRALVVGVDDDLEARERPLRERHRLPGAGVRRGPERDGHVAADGPAVRVREVQRRARDVAVGEADQRLDEVDGAGRDRMVELGLQALAVDGGEGADGPGRRRVTVEGQGLAGRSGGTASWSRNRSPKPGRSAAP